MSVNIWKNFDDKVGELGKKAGELDTIQQKLASLEQRLINVKSSTESYLDTVKSTANDSIKKDMDKKVESLNKILGRLANTKNVSEEMLKKIETAVQNLEGATPKASSASSNETMTGNLFSQPKQTPVVDTIPAPSNVPATPVKSTPAVVTPPPAPAAPAAPVKVAPVQLDAQSKPDTPLPPSVDEKKTADLKNAIDMNGPAQNTRSKTTEERRAISAKQNQNSPGNVNQVLKSLKGGYLSSKKYSQKRGNKRLHKKTLHKKVKTHKKSHKGAKKSKSRRK